MFDRETRWFIHCDTCPYEPPFRTPDMPSKDEAIAWAHHDQWQIRDDVHRCWLCVRDGRTEMAS
jgi:hypothetical protein